jgi:hypothetical protein
MSDFERMSWDEARTYAAQEPVEDAEFTVEYDGDQPFGGPAWEVWEHTWPHRAADARKYLTHFDTSHDVYWYRDARNQRVYGMPDLQLVHAENARITSAVARAEHRVATYRRVKYAVGMLAFLSLVLLGLAPAVIPWIWLALPFVMWSCARAMQRTPRPRYARLAEARFDVFESDQEIRDRQIRRIVIGATLGIAFFWFWLRHHH